MLTMQIIGFSVYKQMIESEWKKSAVCHWMWRTITRSNCQCGHVAQWSVSPIRWWSIGVPWHCHTPTNCSQFMYNEFENTKLETEWLTRSVLENSTLNCPYLNCCHKRSFRFLHRLPSNATLAYTRNQHSAGNESINSWTVIIELRFPVQMELQTNEFVVVQSAQ